MAVQEFGKVHTYDFMEENFSKKLWRENWLE